MLIPVDYPEIIESLTLCHIVLMLVGTKLKFNSEPVPAINYLPGMKNEIS